MRRHGFVLAIALIILGNIGALLVQVSPGVTQRAHELVVRSTSWARTATADALQPDTVVVDLHSPHAAWRRVGAPRHHAARHHAAHRPHRILLVPVYAWHPRTEGLKPLPRRAGTRKTRRERLTASVGMMEQCGFAPWVIDVYRQAGRKCRLLPHEVVKLVATRAARRLLERRAFDEPGRDLDPS
jgi:hypothetical protein